jgi:hypothetical protein
MNFRVHIKSVVLGGQLITIEAPGVQLPKGQRNIRNKPVK